LSARGQFFRPLQPLEQQLPLWQAFAFPFEKLLEQFEPK
jgi:hypothetical protein